WPPDRAWVFHHPLGASLHGCPATPAIPPLDPPLPGGGIAGYAYNTSLGGDAIWNGNSFTRQATKTAQLNHPQWTIAVLDYTNGAGKSTAHPFLVPPSMAFVNADNIARDLRTAGTAEGTAADIAAGRLLLRRLEELVKDRTDFCTESNLANKSLALRIPQWQATGYRVGLYYLWLPDPDYAVARVASRVMKGGHNVPEA